MSSTFVLIPGAWHAASSWFPVARRLRDTGARVDIVELPGQRSTDNEARKDVHLTDAVSTLVNHVHLRELDGVVLVGHSLGGYVIGGALASIRERVRQVIYYAAHVPVAGLSMTAAFPDRMEPLRAAAEASPDGSVPVPDAELVRDLFAPDAGPEVQRLLRDLLVPTPGAYFLEALVRPTRPSDHGLRCAYVLGESDLILPPPASQFPQMLGVTPLLLPGGHESRFTDPDPLAQALLDLAGRSG